MRRIAGAALFGLGSLLVVAAAALAWVIVPALARYPLDLKPPDVVVEAPGATFFSARSLPSGDLAVGVEHGTLRSTTGVKPDYQAAAGLTGGLAGKTLIWNVYQATDWADGNVPINRAESRIALDRKSGSAVAWQGQCQADTKVQQGTTGCEPGSIAYAGQMYLFPFGTEKKTYQYFDGTLRQALPMAYRGEDKVAGMDVYRFEQTVPRQDIATDPESMKGLLGFLAPAAKTGTMNYQASRTLWVEPMTGSIVSYRDVEHREVVPDAGPPIVIFDATFSYDKATAATIIDKTKAGRSQLVLFGRYLPIGLLVAGLLAAVAGLLITRRPAPQGAHAARETPQPEPSAAGAGQRLP